ncbi:MAG: hypothetical protein KAT04_12120 [Methylococcales bacterium]|nr:hypothetical protein [Methylococcales bacterium]
MDIVVKIKGREALVVWTLPYVTSWRLSPDMLLQRLVADEMYVSEKFPIAFTLASDKTSNSLPPAQWYELKKLIEKLELDLTDNNLSRVEDRKAWKKEAIEAFLEDESAY